MNIEQLGATFSRCLWASVAFSFDDATLTVASVGCVCVLSANIF